MERIFRNLKYVMIGAFIFVIIFFYFMVYTPLKDELETSLTNEFKKELSIIELDVENHFKQQIEDMKSLSSRTMIRKKLYQYQQEQITLEELQEYTQPKYVDGIKALDDLIGAYRISNQQIVAKCGQTEIINLERYYQSENKKSKLEIFPQQKMAIISSPIYEQNELLGYDIASFDLSEVFKRLDSSDINYSIVHSAPATNIFQQSKDKIESFRRILNTHYFLKAEMPKNDLYNTLYNFSMLLIVVIIIIIVIIGMTFKFVIDKTSKQVINELEDKNQKIQQALEYHQKYEKLFNNINSGVAVYEAVNDGADFKFVDINKQGQEIDNVDKKELIGKSIKEAFPAVEEFGLFAVLQRVYQTGEAEKFPITEYEDNRMTGYRENYIYKLSTDEVVAVYDDVTEEKRKEEELEETKNRLEMAIEGANLGLWDWNKNTGEIEINDNWLEMLGYEDKEAVQTYQQWKSKIHPEDKKRVLKKLNQHTHGQDSYYESEYRLKTKSGNWKWIKAIGKVMEKDENDNPLRIVGIHQDIDDRKKAEEQIKYLSFHDELTGVYNRRYFENEQERLNSSRRLPISIIIGDMDGLKYINDNYGHQKGDKYIKKVAEIFELVTREEDVVARVGGDEFAVLLPETDADAAEKFCQRFDEKIIKFNKEHQLVTSLEVSLGYATKTKDTQDLKKVFDQADQAMYKNKENGR
ncbi:sensor domain-containing diguanylate cyclase [Halanaerobacter jeridensis]|uniref:Diguanylate cyclase (GGDEF)-like protein/PAS domain S-box-containing protein n=1 Tax=Halanaerobacter jeridensis TaxID=706427 RepID=A0A938XRZ4_9FIRM|nr:diguanylate cyclase [Halanaerobacter jeridensis]MBM7555739.1 diguanylate cyclase (GGDEF)-like protein/PAS domain S-box-containing protein [Halanaerobacter jeridensis]